MRLIDADALDNAFTELRFNADGELAHWGDRKDWCLHGNEIEKLIADAPTVDAEPVRHGRWILHRLGDEYFKCSVCGYQQKAYALSIHFKYCTNCGAKMDGGDGDAVPVED